MMVDQPGGLPAHLLVFLVASLPTIELRGSIPLGISLGIPPWEAYLLSVAGSLLPAVPLLLFFNAAVEYLLAFPRFRRAAEWLVQRTFRKSSKIRRYQALGLFIFVALPFPSTGVWTGCMAAALLKFKMWRALPPVILGTLAAGLIVTLLSCQLI